MQKRHRSVLVGREQDTHRVVSGRKALVFAEFPLHTRPTWRTLRGKRCRVRNRTRDEPLTKNNVNDALLCCTAVLSPHHLVDSVVDGVVKLLRLVGGVHYHKPVRLLSRTVQEGVQRVAHVLADPLRRNERGKYTRTERVEQTRSVGLDATDAQKVYARHAWSRNAGICPTNSVQTVQKATRL